MSNQPSVLLALADDARAIGNQSVDERHVRTVRDGLHVVGEWHVARHEDVRFDLRGRRVGCKCARCIAGGRYGEFVEAVVTRHRNGESQAARLERSGRVRAFVFQKNAGIALAPQHRRPPLAERDRFDLGQDRTIPPHAAPGCTGNFTDHVARCTTFEVREIVSDEQCTRGLAGALIAHCLRRRGG